MTSKFQTFSEKAPVEEFEGAITSSMNIRPDEVILRNFSSNPIINITLREGKKCDLSLHRNLEENSGTLVIPEKLYKEGETETELNNLLSSLFENRRNLEVEVDDQGDKIVIQPINSEKGKFKFTFIR